MLSYPNPHLTNMSICNTIMKIIAFREMVTFKHQTTHQFQHRIQLLLHPQMIKDVNYLVQYTRI